MSDDDDIPEADRVAGAPHPRETAALYGQEAAEAAVLSALASGRMHHAWLLTGPPGIGKATLAWRMARTLLALPAESGGGLFPDTPPVPGSLDMDAAHPVFRRVAALGEPRLKLVRRPWDRKTRRLRTRITVDEIRALKSFFALSAADGGWRVAIVDAADEMNPNAANALLKMLEEPPRRAVLILVSHAPARLLPTIRSRCRTLALKPLGADDLSRALADAGHAPGDDAAALAELSGGSAGTALRLAAEDGPKTYATLVGLMDSAPGLSRPALHRLARSAVGREAATRFDALAELIAVMLARLARTGASGAVPPEAAPGEAKMLSRLAETPAQARVWAEAAEAIPARIAQARAVNLDPAGIVMQAGFALDEAAQTALRTAPTRAGA